MFKTKQNKKKQQQDLRREIAVLKSLHTSQFDRIAEDTLMLLSDDCAIKQRLKNTENESEGAQSEMAILKEENENLKQEQKINRAENGITYQNDYSIMAIILSVR